MSTKLIIKDEFHFNGYAVPWPFTSVTVGTPTGVAMNGGQVDLALAATNEVESVRLSMGDMLAYPIANIIEMSFWAKVTASLNAAVTVSMGLAAAGNAAPTSIAARSFFRLIGNNNVAINTYDGTLTNSDVSTGFLLANAFTKFTMNFADGTVTIGPPSSQKGGQGGQRDILYRMEQQLGASAANTVLRQVGKRTLFDMGNYSGGLQPYFQIQKTASTAVGTLSIRRIEVSYKL